MMNRGIHVRTIDDLLNMKLDTEIGKGKNIFHHFESICNRCTLHNCSRSQNSVPVRALQSNN